MHYVFNWKTTALGIAALVSAGAHWYALGTAPDAGTITGILAAFGLIAASDAQK